MRQIKYYCLQNTQKNVLHNVFQVFCQRDILLFYFVSPIDRKRYRTETCEIDFEVIFEVRNSKILNPFVKYFLFQLTASCYICEF